jgi:hypothetical protein
MSYEVGEREGQKRNCIKHKPAIERIDFKKLGIVASPKLDSEK